MTTSHDPAEPNDAASDLALYALDALDDAEMRPVETRLATDAVAAAAEGRLRRAAGTMAAAADGIDAPPPPSLRDRVLAAARRERAPQTDQVEPTEPGPLHQIQGEQLIDLLRSLTATDWAAPVDPPELAGWTVADVVAHLATVEAHLATQLGVRDPAAAEQQVDNEQRTAAAIERHRSLRPAEAVAELEAFLRAVDDAVASGVDPAARQVDWWEAAGPLDRTLIVRSVELWTHAADIARAVGRPEPVPPAPSLRTVSTLATALTPVLCQVAGTLPSGPTGRWVRFELTGPGGATHDVGVDLGTTPSGDPDATLTVDIVDYCRAVAKRVGRDELEVLVTGDRQLAAAVVAALPALAVL